MASMTLVLQTNKYTTDMVKTGQRINNWKKITNLINGLASGNLIGSATVTASTIDPVAASATITVASVLAADTVTIGKIVLTGSATPSGIAQFLTTGTDTVVAAAIVVKINAHTTLGLLVQAANVAGVITVTSTVPGVVGNHIGLASSNGTRLAVTGSGYLASGAGGSGTASVKIR
jgi:hypothetical protein